jgi:hydrogenase expression/formation protein HypD
VPGKGSQRAELLKLLEDRLRRNDYARLLVRKIHELAPKAVERVGQKPIKIMDFCGTHEYTVTHFGIRTLMPPEVEIVAGPGCPVCITPAYYVDVMIKLAMEGITVYTYGDAYKLPGSARVGEGIRSLEEARAAGGSVVVVYSVLDAIKLARESGKPGVFFAVGFETTTPATASPVVAGKVPPNLKILNVHRLTPPIMRYTFATHRDNPIRGVIAPGHVST